MLEYQSVGALIRKQENDYISGVTQISKYVSFSQFENIEKIDAYLNSKHISGETDSMGRDKPFFNIVTGAVNIWYRATDIDRKDIRIKATNQKQYLGAFLATIHLQEWMKKDAFGTLLNEWGRSLARYGSSVLKFVEKKDGLHCKVVSWNTLISDAVDFDNNPQIEKLYFTQGQLKENKSYDKDQVKALIDALKVREGVGKEKKDTKANYIEVYELHGLLPLSYLTEKDSDADTFVQQMHVISFVKNEKTGEYDDFTLLKGKEAKSPYMITHLIKEEGRSQSIGAVEHLFEAQWMSNHSVKAIKDQLDLASKLIFQTSDGSFVGQNALTNIETGDILIHRQNEPLTQVANTSHDITSLQNFGQQWQVLAKEITATPDAISGNTMPSGTAYRTVAILNQESHSLFELMTENKGLAIEEMMRKYVIPYLKKQMDTSKEIAVTLDSHGIKQIDSMYVKNEATRRVNQKIKDTILNGSPEDVMSINPDQQQADIQSETDNIQGTLDQQGNQRFIRPSDMPDKTWAELFKDLEWEVEVEVTNEQSDKQVVLATLQTIFQTIGSNPAVLEDPNMKMLFNKILETTGSISPIELTQSAPKQDKSPANKISESISYKDAPPDIQRQMEAQAGMKPSQVGAGQPVETTQPKVGGSKL